MDGDQKFIFDAKNKDSKNMSALRKAKTVAMLPDYRATLKKTFNNIKEEQNGLKTQKVNGVLSSSGHATTKSPPNTKVLETVTPHKNSSLTHLKSPPVPDASKDKVIQKKTEVKPVVNGVLKSPQRDEKVKERPKVKVKEEKDGRARGKSESEHNENGKGTLLKSNSTSKSKPPKIQLPER